MDSRMSKYNEEKTASSRQNRNVDLYKEINNSVLDNFNVQSNATVLGKQDSNIDIDKIKKILDTKYNEPPKRKSIRLEDETIDDTTNEYPTKEYDLNVILEKAKDDKEETYNEVRNKKLRDTQFDILKNLSIPEVKDENKEEDLLNLINTITINEAKKKEIEEKENAANPLDILTDLKGDENTEIFDGIKEEIEKIEKTSKILNNTTKIDDSFYTTSNLFKKKDFNKNDDFEDEKLGIGIKILIVLLVIAFLVGLFIFLKSILNF
ncbi:MAG: hypothetical protein RSE17_02445 [Bacilli bacterium]